MDNQIIQIRIMTIWYESGSFWFFLEAVFKHIWIEQQVVKSKLAKLQAYWQLAGSWPRRFRVNLKYELIFRLFSKLCKNFDIIMTVGKNVQGINNLLWTIGVIIII